MHLLVVILSANHTENSTNLNKKISRVNVIYVVFPELLNKRNNNQHNTVKITSKFPQPQN